MSKNINSFSQNVNQVISHSTNTLALLTAQQRALTENDTFVTFDYTDTNGNTIQYQLPSYDSVVNRLKAVEESINSLNNGRGSINLTDGSRRTITLSSIAHTPNQITDMEDPTTFQIDSNWFFESLMYPSAFVSIDLSGKIEDSADRVRVVRIILDARDINTQTLWQNDLSVNKYDYISLRTLLSNNGISYYEDEDTIDLPLKSNTVSGAFQITEDPQTINGNIWYTLDSINYSTISVNGMNQGLNNILSVGDRLSYQESIFEIIEINQNNNKVRLKRVSGAQNPGVYGMLYYYTDPLASKSVNVHFGAHEYNIVYIKGIAEAYNLLADNWSTPIVFSTDELMLEGTSGLRETPFSTYYEQYIMDWGSQMIDEVKERRITAYKGSTPNTPVLNAADFRVVQINTQINAAIDTTDVKNTASEIESVKSQISSLKSTIAAQKSDLQSAVNAYTYNSIQEQIATNTKDLQNLQTTYTTLVKSFQTTVKENAAITTEPKYHIRGFFPIPTLKFLDEAQTIAEEIIGFDIAYRYITEDNTSTQLNTFTYTDTDGQTEITGTFTDWVVERGPMKTRVFDEEMQRYVWRAENVADGTETNINQIDIAISRGEKVEIKVRAISEAGYSTNNPLLSPWSNVITMEFPSTLASTNEIADLITEVNDDAINIAINNNLEAIGVITHLSDTIPNTNSVNGMYYVHTAKNIAYEEHGQNANGTSVVNSISVQDKIDSLYEEYKNTNNIVSNNVKDIADIKETMTERHQVYESEFVDISTHLNALDASAVDIEEKFESIVNKDGYLYTKKLLFNNDDNTTKVVLSTLNRSQLFVLDGTQMNDDMLTNVHAHEFVYYPSGHTVGENDGVRVSTKFESQDLHFVSVDNSVNIINSSVNAIEDFNKTVALRSDLLDVSKVASDVRDTVNGFYTKNGDSTEITATHVFLGKHQTKLSANDMSGALYVLTGQSDTQLGTVHVDDVAMHNAGDTGNTAVLMSDINQNVIVNTNSIQNLQLTVTEMNNLIERAIYIDSGNVQLRGETAVIND